MTREMKESGVIHLGNIPSHWRLKRIKDVSDVLRGGSPRPIEEYLTDDADGIPWIKIGDTITRNIHGISITFKKAA